MSAFEILGLATAVAVGLAALAFWVAMIGHCWRSTQPGTRRRWVWLAIVVLGKLPGALAYYLLHGQPAAAGEPGSTHGPGSFASRAGG